MEPKVTNTNDVAQTCSKIDGHVNNAPPLNQLPSYPPSYSVTLIAYLTDLLRHLLKNQEQSDFKLLLIAPDNIANTVTTSINQTLATDSFAQYEVSIDSMTPDAFLQVQYHIRYDLGCLITAIIDHTPPNEPSQSSYLQPNTLHDYKIVNDTPLSETTTKDTTRKGIITTQFKDNTRIKNDINQIVFISTRLRDLFASQCVVILDKELSKKSNLRSLGYTQTDMLEHCIDTANLSTAPSITLANLDIVIWQFNLYDYKPEPDWLNARYWANPENFDKYRW